MGVLREFGLSLAGFDGLRADAYEKQVAKRSVKELETFYGALLRPGAGYLEIQRECPGWGKDNKPPGISTLRSIRQRIITEQSLQEVDAKMDLVTLFASKLTGLPVPAQAEAMNAVLALVMANLMGLVGEGEKVIDHLPAVDRVIRVVATKGRLANWEARNEIAREGMELKRQWQDLQQGGRMGTRGTRPSGSGVAREYARPTDGGVSGPVLMTPEAAEKEARKTDRLSYRAFGALQDNPNRDMKAAIKQLIADGVAPASELANWEQYEREKKENEERRRVARERKERGEIGANADKQNSNDEIRNPKEDAVSEEAQKPTVVESAEERRRRLTAEAEQKRWEQRQMAIRDKAGYHPDHYGKAVQWQAQFLGGA